MASTPYDPAPEVGPSGIATPNLRAAAAVEEASGVGVGRAMQGLGGEVSKVGDMLAQNALALQRMQNEIDGKNLDVEAMIKIGQENSKFDLLEGDAATKALPGFHQRIKEIRQEVLDKAPNLDTRRLVDQSIMRQVGFAIVNAGHKAGTQMRKALDDAAIGRINIARSGANPRDPEAYSDAYEKVMRESLELATRKGMLPAGRTDFLRKQHNEFYLETIPKFAVTNPEQASELFDTVKDGLENTVRDTIQAKIDREMATKQTTFDAQDILKKYDMTDEKLKLGELIAEAKAVGERKYPNNADAQRLLLTKVESGVNLSKKIYNDRMATNKETVFDYMQGKKPEDRIIDMDGINGPNAPKEVRDAYNDLPAKDKIQIQRRVAQPVPDIPLAGEALKRYRELVGMASQDKEAFADVDILSEKIPEKQKTELYKQQLAQGRKAEPYTDIGRYVGWAKRIMDYYKIFPDRGSQSTQLKYLQFVGALEIEINTYKEDNKKMPGEKDVVEMAKRLGQTVITSPGTVWDTKARRFEIAVPEAAKQEIINRYSKGRNRSLTDAEIRYIYYKKQEFKEVPNELP